MARSYTIQPDRLEYLVIRRAPAKHQERLVVSSGTYGERQYAYVDVYARAEADEFVKAGVTIRIEEAEAVGLALLTIAGKRP